MKEDIAWILRLAEQNDVPQIEALIHRSSFGLQLPYYSRQQIEAAMGPVFGVDEQLIKDGTYYIAESKGTLIGCGGWSYRKSLFGGNSAIPASSPKLKPKQDSARIRAFFVDPEYARQGIGSRILRECEKALRQMKFTSVEISATLPGELLYQKFGYNSVNHYTIPLEGTDPMLVVKMTKEFPH